MYYAFNQIFSCFLQQFLMSEALNSALFWNYSGFWLAPAFVPFVIPDLTLRFN